MPTMLKNIMETLALQKLDESIDKLGCCKCEQCRMDIVSYALNRLPPRYVATHEGEIYSKLVTLSTQYDLDILSALIQGVEIVKCYPRHTSDDIENMLDAEKLSQQEALKQEERLKIFKEQEAIKELEKQATAEFAASGTLDTLGLENIDLSDLPPDLPNREELLNLLNPTDDQSEKSAE